MSRQQGQSTRPWTSSFLSVRAPCSCVCAFMELSLLAAVFSPHGRVMPSESHLATSGCYFSRLKDVALGSTVVVITQPTDPARPNLSLPFQTFPALRLSPALSFSLLSCFILLYPRSLF